ncbi:MAG: phospholipase A [Pseudomonadales bacterium]
MAGIRATVLQDYLALALMLTLGLAQAAQAETISEEIINEDISDACLLDQLKQSGDAVTIGELKARCQERANDPTLSLVLDRRLRERATAGIRSILTPHNRNYMMPVSYLGDPNEEPYRDAIPEFAADRELNTTEIKFQLSLKFNIINDLLLKDDSVHFGFTALSFWQAYNSDISAPFRETNYEPELFWTAPIDWRPFALNANVMSIGFSHQSNGQTGTLSRSWNRIYANFVWEKNRFVFSLKPWWRIPEDEKEDRLQAEGDDNPDIERYLGHFEFTTSYRRKDQEFSLKLRNNLRSSNKGAVQLDYTFPLWRGIRGFAQYFNGYGESLIDYNANVERFGVGILLSDLL